MLGGRFHLFPMPMYGPNMFVKLDLLDRIDINPKRKSSEQNFGPHCLHCFDRKLEGGRDRLEDLQIFRSDPIHLEFDR